MKDYITHYDEWSDKEYVIFPCVKCKFNNKKHEIINHTCIVTPWCWLKDKNTSTIFGCSDGEVD